MLRRGLKLSERELQSQEPALGSIDTFWFNDTYTGRYLHVARCFDGHMGLQPKLLPSLYDIVIEDLGNSGARIRGIERIKSKAGDLEQFPQTWWIRW